MSQRQQSKVTRSVKDILVSHEERLQQISQQLQISGGFNTSRVSDSQLTVKLQQSDELQRKLMANQRTFNNSLQLLNGRLSKVEQLLVELTLDLKNLKKEQVNNVSLTIQEETQEETTQEESTQEETTQEETTQETTEEETTQEETIQETTEETTQETTQEETTNNLKDEVKEEVKKEKK